MVNRALLAHVLERVEMARTAELRPRARDVEPDTIPISEPDRQLAMSRRPRGMPHRRHQTADFDDAPHALGGLSPRRLIRPVPPDHLIEGQPTAEVHRAQSGSRRKPHCRRPGPAHTPRNPVESASGVRITATVWAKGSRYSTRNCCAPPYQKPGRQFAFVGARQVLVADLPAGHSDDGTAIEVVMQQRPLGACRIISRVKGGHSLIIVLPGEARFCAHRAVAHLRVRRPRLLEHL